MRTNLLTKGFFARLLEAEDFDELHSLMEKTVYRREINEVILLDPERPDYDQAFNQNLVASLRKIQDSTGGEPHRLVNLLLSRWDILNIKSILRGKHGRASNSSIFEVIVPVGNINMGHGVIGHLAPFVT
jgi:V/A-type H+-transporting ATPase subunit C